MTTKTVMKSLKSNKMSIIRIAPVCGGKIYMTPNKELPIEEEVEHVDEKSDKKARKVLQTSIDLSSKQDDGNEMFGTSPIARTRSNATSSRSSSGVKRLPTHSLTP